MTADEIRARWAGIDLDGLWDWDHKDLRRQVEHGVIDIDYLLRENERLRTALGQIADGSPYSVEEQSSRYYRDIARKTLQLDNAIPTQLGRNSDDIDWLLKENKRLRMVLGLYRDLYSAAVWASYYARKLMDIMDDDTSIQQPDNAIAGEKE